MYNNAKFLIILMSNYNNTDYYNSNKYDEPIRSTTNFPHQQSPTSHLAVLLIIFAAAMILIVLMSLVLCTVCCKYYRRRESRFFGRSSSFASLQELIRARLQDRPPTYHESQSSLATAQSDLPPPYQEVVQNAGAVEPTVFIVSSKRIISNENDENLPRFVEDDSDSDSPPSYYNSEGIVNTLLQENNNSHTVDNRNVLELESYSNLPVYSNMLHI